ELGWLHLKSGGQRLHAVVLLGQIRTGRSTRYSLDTPHAGAHGTFAQHAYQADITGSINVGSAAQLDGVRLAGLLAVNRGPHRDDTDLIAVLLAEQRHRAF